MYLYISLKLFSYIVSDCDSVEVMHERLKWLGDTAEDAVGQAMKAGKFKPLPLSFSLCIYIIYVL